MNATLMKAVALLAVAGALFAFTATRRFRTRPLAASLQLTGTGCWVMVALVHVCEALGLFPGMGWGEEHSVGHYLDLGSAVLGTGLLVIGFLLQSASRHRNS